MRRRRREESLCFFVLSLSHYLLILAIIGITSTSCCYGLVPTQLSPTQRILINNRYTSICVAATAADSTLIKTIADDEQLVKQLGGAFTQKLVELEEYKKNNGDCLVPRRYEENPSLGNFVNKQRQSYRKFLMGEKSSMNQVSTTT